MSRKHGRSAYVGGCRCSVCVRANREYQREYLRARVKAGLTDRSGRRYT